MPRDVIPVDEVGQVLLKAADLLESKGWCKGAVQDGAGRICALQAICLAAGTEHFAMHAADTAADLRARAAITRMERSVGADDICSWNNTRHSLAEVTATMRAVAVQP